MRVQLFLAQVTKAPSKISNRRLSVVINKDTFCFRFQLGRRMDFRSLICQTLFPICLLANEFQSYEWIVHILQLNLNYHLSHNIIVNRQNGFIAEPIT